MDKIIIKGAKEHNLKNIDLELPRDKFIVFTGLSGSGKSTLAFDTIFAEGQRRYLESLSAYARQFLHQMDKPDVEYIEGLSPAISIDQKSASHNPRSTVGTVTEIYDYMRLLFAKVGVPHCPQCGKEINQMTIEQIVDKILEKSDNSLVDIYAPVVRGRKGEYLQFLNDLYRKGYIKARVDGELLDLSQGVSGVDRYKQHDIEVLIDKIKVDKDKRSRIFESVENALKLAEGMVLVRDGENETLYNQKLTCPYCDLSFPELEPRLFSFNSPYGACPVCDGLGTEKEFDVSLIASDKNKTIEDGGILPWTYKRNNYYGMLLRAVCGHYRIPTNVRLKDLKPHKFDLLMNGPAEIEKIKVNYNVHGHTNVYYLNFKGILPHLKERYKKTESDAVRNELEKYINEAKCPQCGGARLKKESLHVRVGGKNIAEICEMSIKNVAWFFDELKLGKRDLLIVERVIKEIKNRLGFLNKVGLDYLTLSRGAITLAGGETQRIRLASQVGSSLVGVLYILDEPSIGLHARDNAKLLETLKHLRDLGNTLIVIEHDEETMREADYIVDIGPRAGVHGGEIVGQGIFADFLQSKNSLTAQYLRGDKVVPIPEVRRKAKKKFLQIKGACENNLKNVSVDIPLGVLTCVTGVSGSGKSTLVEDILYKALSRKIQRSLEKPGRHKEILGTEFLNKVIMIDQSPIGRTPRSNPATYTGVFTLIRDLFARTKEAKIRGYAPGRFSFNVSGGRCEVCKGDGFLKVEMQFLPDVYVPCDVCGGGRYNKETLKIKFQGKNIAEVLDMTVEEAAKFFEEYPNIADKLKTLNEVGLGYIKLGQSATTLSGGEAQRIKLAAELSRPATGKTLYILDEPTTGLHFEDINSLLDVLNRLIEKGNSVVVIEHNMDVIKTADYIIDLGPEGGDEGGRVVVAGSPEEVVKYHKESYTAKYLKDVLRKR